MDEQNLSKDQELISSDSVPEKKKDKDVEKKKANKKPNIFVRIGKWFRDLRSEAKKVVWPTGKQVVNNTVVVLVVALVVCVFVGVLDFVFGFLRDTLVMLF